MTIQEGFQPARPQQIYVTVSAIHAGELTLPDHFFMAGADPSIRTLVPSLSFFIRHGDCNLLFDGGLRQKITDYGVSVSQRIEQNFTPMIVSKDAASFLKEKGQDPAKIDTVILSHVHWDHIGSPHTFPNAKYVVGHGSINALKNGCSGYDAAQFEEDLFEFHKVLELPPVAISDGSNHSNNSYYKWQPLAHFPNAIDYFGDGSLWIIDSPGHMPGHINLLARTGPTNWVYLGGDSCHYVRILNGDTGISEYFDAHGTKKCAHADKKMAEATISRMRVLSQGRISDHKFEVVLAHDYQWCLNNKDSFYPGFI